MQGGNDMRLWRWLVTLLWVCAAPAVADVVAAAIGAPSTKDGTSPTKGTKGIVPPADRHAPVQTTFTQKQIESFASEVVPHIERTLGRTFKSVPPILVGDADAVAQILAADLEGTIRKDNPKLKDAEVRQLALAQARERTPDVLGKYGVKAKKLGLMPENLLHALRENRTDAKHAPAIMRLLVAHELTHALQAQYVDILDLLDRQPTEDAIAAYTAVIEGQAMYVQERVGRALGLGAALSEYAKVFSLGELDFADPDSQTEEVYRRFIYTVGRQFTEYHVGKGGVGRLWEILAKPPALSSMISRPETYSTSPPKRPDLSKVFAGVPESFPAKRWVVSQRDLGDIQLRSAHTEMSAAELDALSDRVLAARTLDANLPHEGHVQITLFVLNDPKAAPKVIDLLHAPMVRNAKAMRQDPAYRVKQFTDGKYTEVPSDDSRSCDVIVTDKSGHTILDQKLTLVSRGTVVLQVFTNWRGLPKAKQAKIIEEILKRAAKAASAAKG